MSTTTRHSVIRQSRNGPTSRNSPTFGSQEIVQLPSAGNLCRTLAVAWPSAVDISQRTSVVGCEVECPGMRTLHGWSRECITVCKDTVTLSTNTGASSIKLWSYSPLEEKSPNIEAGTWRRCRKCSQVSVRCIQLGHSQCDQPSDTAAALMEEDTWIALILPQCPSIAGLLFHNIPGHT